jgi:hypothetical protein
VAARRLTLPAAAALACVVAGGASAAFTPAWSYLAAPLRATLAAKAGGPLFLPARTPLFYRYRSGASVHAGVLSVTFTNRVRVRKGLWRWTKQTFSWQVSPLPSGVGCADWGGSQKTLQVDGNKAYWAAAAAGGGKAWRCVTDQRGRKRVLVASDTGRLPDVALAIVAASGLDVSGRR